MDDSKQRDPKAILNRLLDMGEDEVLLNIGEESVVKVLIYPPTTETDTVESDIRLENALAANSIDELVTVIESGGGCDRCNLASGRNKIVVGAGDPDARIVFIGEGPGANEDKTGIPFVGRAGQLLDKIFAAMGLSREKGIYICNIVKCRPPGNRDPLPDESEACIPYLKKQLELINPAAICCLGRVAAQNLLETDAALGKLRGKIHFFEGVPVVVTYHPAYLLRNAAGKKPTWEDMKLLMKTAGMDIPDNGNR